MSAPAVVRISARGAKRLYEGHLWIYTSDVLNTGGADGGDVVAVHDDRGHDLGYAFYSDSSQIVLRWCAPPGPAPDRAFWRARFARAITYRERVVQDTDAYRLIYSEGDLLSSLIIDRYGDHFVLQTLSQGTDRLKDLWIDLLQERFSPASIIERNEASVRDYEQLPRQKSVLAGTPPDEVVITMNGVAFGLELLGGQKTGAFLDQRENYAATAQYAHGRALDAFTFAGGFALHLAPHVEDILATDISGDASKLARNNAERNGLANVDVETVNAFDLLRDLDRAGEKFDTIVLDPPAFAKGKAALEGAYRGYKEINLRALRMLTDGGVLVTCSCSYHMHEQLFLEMLADAATDANRHLRIIEQRVQARDHPMLLGVPETKYLKCVIAQVI